MMGDDVFALSEQLSKAKVCGPEVSFAGKGLKLDTEKDAEEIVEAIKKCPDMVTLKLEGNTFGVDACKAVSKALEQCPKFQKAHWKDMFTGRLKTEIPQALRFLSGGIMLAKAQLVELDLSDNAFGPIGVDGISELINSSACYSLKELRLNNNGLGIGGGKKLAQALMDCYGASLKAKTPFALRVFISGRNRLENDGAIALANVFKTLKTLEHVSMPQNGIYHEGISHLAEAFSNNPNLRILDLNDNTFTEKGGKAMANAISKLKNLDVINFGDCLLRTDGAIFIANALKTSNTNLKEVQLGFNEIGKDGGIAIAECVVSKPLIKTVSIDGNQFGEEGCSAITEIFENAGKEDVLDSLDEDEGDGEDDDEEQDDDDDENYEDVDDEEGKDEYEEEEPADNSRKYISPLRRDQVNVPTFPSLNTASPLVKVTVKSFFENPTESGLLQLSNKSAKEFSDELGETTVEQAVECFMKVSFVVKSDTGKANDAAYRFADVLMSRACKKAEESDEVYVLSNLLLIHLGLIKSEDKKFKPLSNLLGPLIVLEHVIRQDYFHRSSREVLQVFLSKPAKSVDQYSIAKHKLMQTLYKF